MLLIGVLCSQVDLVDTIEPDVLKQPPSTQSHRHTLGKAAGATWPLAGSGGGGVWPPPAGWQQMERRTNNDGWSCRLLLLLFCQLNDSRGRHAARSHHKSLTQIVFFPRVQESNAPVESVCSMASIQR